MNLKLSPLALVVLLAGCGKGAGPASESPSMSPTQASSPDCAQFYSPLPADVRLGFPYHLRSDRIFNKKGKVRRRVTLELLQGTAGEAFASASQSLTAAGYKARKQPKGEATSRQSQGFKKKGQPSIALASSVDVGTKPANPEAKGLVTFEWAPPGMKPAAAHPAAPVVTPTKK